MKRLTITLDEETAARARAHAARKGVSLSRFIGALLRDRMRESSEYEGAMRRYLASSFVLPLRDGAHRLTRSEAHDRATLRRR